MVLPNGSMRVVHPDSDDMEYDDDDLKPIRKPTLLVRARTMLSIIFLLACHVVPWWLLLIWIST
jgi:hypothetical protein